MTYYAQDYAGIIGGSLSAAGYYNNEHLDACSEVATSHVHNWQSLFIEDL